MRISFDVNPLSYSGKSKFACHLKNELTKKGIKVGFFDDSAQIKIPFARLKGNKKPGDIIIGRFAGVSQWDLGKNEACQHLYDASDIIIFQSKATKRLCEKYLGKCEKPYFIIFNGLEIPVWPQKLKIWKPGEKIHIQATGKFRRGARMRSYFEYVRYNKDVILHLNMNPKWFKDTSCPAGVPDDIKDRVIIPEFTHHPYYNYWDKDLFLSLIHFDGCGNAECEALAYGLPIIYTNLGGRPEFIGNAGVMIDYDFEDFKALPTPFDLNDIPVEIIDKAVMAILNNHYEYRARVEYQSYTTINIKKIANQYYNVIKFAMSKYV